MDKNTHPFKRVELEHMAEIVPKKGATGEEHTKNLLLRYNESALEIYNDTSLHSNYLYQDNNDIDYNFFKEQYDFLLSLSTGERIVLNVYSSDPGYKLLSKIKKYYYNKEFLLSEIEGHFLIRYDLSKAFNIPFSYDRVEPKPKEYYEQYEFGTLSPEKQAILNEYEKKESEYDSPTLKSERTYTIAIKYYDTLKAILEKAPPVKKQMRVFRGIKVTPEEYSESYIPRIFSGIVSTTYSPSQIINYTETIKSEGYLGSKSTKCCAFDILIQPGVKAVWLSPVSTFHTASNMRSQTNDRDNTEREIVLWCDETIRAKVSKPKPKRLLRKGNNENRDTYITYDVVLGPISQAMNTSSNNISLRPFHSKLTRSLGQRKLVTNNAEAIQNGGRGKLKRKTRKARKSRRVAKKRAHKQRGGAFSIESISPENEHETIVTIRPDSREEDSIPMTMRLTTARKLLEDTDTHA